MSEGPAAAGRNGARRWSKSGTSFGSDVLRLVLCTQPRFGKFARPVTIPGEVQFFCICLIATVASMTSASNHRN